MRAIQARLIISLPCPVLHSFRLRTPMLKNPIRRNKTKISVNYALWNLEYSQRDIIADLAGGVVVRIVPLRIPKQPQLSENAIIVSLNLKTLL